MSMAVISSGEPMKGSTPQKGAMTSMQIVGGMIDRIMAQIIHAVDAYPHKQSRRRFWLMARMMRPVRVFKNQIT